MKQSSTESKAAKHDHPAQEDEAQRRRRERWRAENREAIEAWNRWVQENGIPFEELKAR